uniref:Uncharacterized protein n=1 Tax=Arundo donax TaxID=35708 RepID=A0A0A9GEV1_ARUDO
MGRTDPCLDTGKLGKTCFRLNTHNVQYGWTFNYLKFD